MHNVDRSLWVEDRYALRCRACGEKFTFFRRRHHCRLCGQVFCSACLFQLTGRDGVQLRDLVLSSSNPLATTFHAFEEEEKQHSLPERVCKRCATGAMHPPRTSGGSNSEHHLHPIQSADEWKQGSFSPFSASSTVVKTPGSVHIVPELSQPTPFHEVIQTGNLLSSFQCENLDASLERVWLEDVEGSSQNRQLPKLPPVVSLRHPETEEDKSISYAMAKLPPRYRNSLHKWLEKQLHDANLVVSMSETNALFLSSPKGGYCSLTRDPIPVSTCKGKDAAGLTISFAEPLLLSRSYSSAAKNVFAGMPLNSLWMPNEGSTPHPTTQADALYNFLSDPNTQELFAMHWLRRVLNNPTFTEFMQLSVHESIEGGRDGSDTSNLALRVTPWLQAIYTTTARVLSKTAVALGGHIHNHVEIVALNSYMQEPRADAQDNFEGLYQIDILPGVAFKRSLVSKRMPSYWVNPRILFLGGRVSYKMQSLSISEYVDSYEGHLEKLFHRILVWSPQVIVVEGGMHHYLQTRVTNTGVMSLVLNVGTSLLTRLASCCGAAVVYDLDYITVSDLHDEKTPLGMCGIFRVVTVSKAEPPLCVFEQLPTKMFSTVVLRGPHPSAAVGPEYHRIKAWLLESLATTYHVVSQGCTLWDLGMEMQKSNDASSGVWFDQSTRSVNFTDFQSVYYFLQAQERCAALSINYGIRFGDDVLRLFHGKTWTVDAHDRLRDQIHVQCIALDTLRSEPLSLLTAGEYQNEGNPISSTSSDTQIPTSVRSARDLHAQKHNTYAFYQKEKDQTVLGFLVKHSKERLGSRMMICHGKHQILVSKCNVPEALHTSKSSDNGESMQDFLEIQSKSLMFRLGGDENDCLSRTIWDMVSHFARPPGCYVDCPFCRGSTWEAEQDQPPPELRLLSPHTLCLSMGCFLELLFNAHTSLRHVSCTHAMDKEFSICFVCHLSASRPGVRIRLDVKPLTVYRLRHPCCALEWEPAGGKGEASTPTQPPSSPAVREDDDDDVLLERRELYADLALLQSALSCVVEEAAEAGASSSASTTTTSPCDGNRAAAAAVDAPRTPPPPPPFHERVEALRRASAGPTTAAGLVALRWAALRPLLADVKDWQRRHRPALARVENPKWWFSPADHAAMRADEPTSVLRAALARLYGAEKAASPPPAEAGAAPAKNNNPGAGEGGGCTVCFPKTIDRAYQILLEASKMDKPSEFGNQTIRHRITLGDLASASGEPIGSATIDVFFPAPFAALQYMFFRSGPEKSLLRSLARCGMECLEGGKSSARFYRTWDGLLLKRIKWMEMKHFVMGWGPEYFRHMARCFACELRNDDSESGGGSSAQPPNSAGVLLAKVLGLYAIQITCRSSSQEGSYTNTVGETQYYVLIENLTLRKGVHVDIAFDLKGSQRNRTAPEGSSVKLDADLVEQIRNGRFIFCSSAQKHMMMRTLCRDTELLCNSGIMDYSLLTALDASRGEILLGLIDFFYPYTGAKLLESRVKSGIDTVLGYSGRDPTIIGPPDYKERFLRYMNVYFCGIPSKLFPLIEEVDPNEERKTTLGTENTKDSKR